MVAKYKTTPSKDGIVFEILDGDYIEYQYLYGTVSLEEPKPPAIEATLKFNYNIIYPEGTEATDEFTQVAGDILQNVILGLDEGHIETVDYNDIDSEVEKVL
jgi:hypothetical protein